MSKEKIWKIKFITYTLLIMKTKIKQNKVLFINIYGKKIVILKIHKLYIDRYIKRK